MPAMSDLPYRTDYAKSGKSICRSCGSNIDHKTLRIAVMVQCQFSDKKMPNWYHPGCFFMCHKPTTAADISNIITLQYKDKVLIEKEIDKINKQGKVKQFTKKRAANKENVASDVALKHFRVENSSSLAFCRHCDDKISMIIWRIMSHYNDEVRICKDKEDGGNYGDQPLWYHFKCFKEERNTLHYFAGGESLPGFNTLSKHDQAMVQSEIKPLDSDDVPMKKLKVDPIEELEEDQNREKEIEKQNKLFYKYKEALSIFKKREIKELLEYNCQEVNTGPDECLNLLADIMAFGALLPCPECIEGKLVLDTLGYKCTAYTKYTKCSYVTQDPMREPMIIHDSYENMGPFEEFTPKVDVRLFPVETSVENSIKSAILSLQNLQFFLYGNLEDMEDTERSIIKMGGLVVPELTETTVAVVSTKEDVERMSEKMLEIQDKDIKVVEASYLDTIARQSGTIAKSLQLIKEHNIAQWGSEPAASRLSQDVFSGTSCPMSESMDLTASTTSSITLKIKGGSAVDLASALEDVAHVYRDSEGTKYAVTLCQTDVVTQTNKYYKMQVLEKDDKEEYYLFRSWGKTATQIGSNKLDDYGSAEEAVDFFEKKYNEKTGNDWINRDAFQKKPGLYYQLDVDYGEEAVTPQVDKDCVLALPVQKLITTIFNTDIMKETLLEFQLDTELMPLGMLSKEQIKSGQEVLSELQNYIENGSARRAEIIDATNRFFTLIPHNFGTGNATLLDNLELIKKKAEMLNNLLEIEIAYSLLKTNSDKTVSPIESYYTKLKADITPLAKNSDEFQLLQEYARNTHSEYHSKFSLEIEEVFKVVRHDEEERYHPFWKLHNRRLLWHGSRVTNYARILSQGLRIAPPDAPVTGHMFGKGIYFADMVSKSAHYCHAKYNSCGLMLLCEVALGNMKECYGAENVKLPADKHSAWGVGRTEPDPAGSKTLDCGTIVPMGKPYNKQVNTSLRHNEFIVYDAAQVNVKYLLQMKFNHTY